MNVLPTVENKTVREQTTSLRCFGELRMSRNDSRVLPETQLCPDLTPCTGSLSLDGTPDWARRSRLCNSHPFPKFSSWAPALTDPQTQGPWNNVEKKWQQLDEIEEEKHTWGARSSQAIVRNPCSDLLLSQDVCIVQNFSINLIIISSKISPKLMAPFSVKYCHLWFKDQRTDVVETRVSTGHSGDRHWAQAEVSSCFLCLQHVCHLFLHSERRLL